jgi:hypothetical protein
MIAFCSRKVKFIILIPFVCETLVQDGCPVEIANASKEISGYVFRE